jgi:hypothetical protein
MNGRQWGATLLVWLTACASSPRVSATSADPYEAELAAIRYELRVLTAGAVDTQPVKVDAEDFQEAMKTLALHVRASERPRETARWLLEGELRAELLAEVEDRRVVRMVPLEEGSRLSTASNAQLLADYRLLCERQYGGGDCLGLTADGPVLDREDRRTLALAFAFEGVLEETRQSLKHMVSPQAVLTLVVSAAVLYFALWLVPEPLTKGVAALISIGLLAWLGAQTLWELMEGWGRLVHEADRATTLEELRQAGRRYSKVMGENTARVVFLVVTAAVGGGAAKFSQRLPLLPGYSRAAVHAEAQGVRLAAAGEVEAVAAPAEGTFTLMVPSAAGRSRRRRPARVSPPSSATREATGRCSTTSSAGTCRLTSPSRTSRSMTLSATTSWLPPGRYATNGVQTICDQRNSRLSESPEPRGSTGRRISRRARRAGAMCTLNWRSSSRAWSGIAPGLTQSIQPPASSTRSSPGPSRTWQDTAGAWRRNCSG